MQSKTKIISGAERLKNLQRIKDAFTVKKIYTGCHGQLKFILQYLHHYVYFLRKKDYERATLMLYVIETEYQNILSLDQVVLSLGVNPFCEKVCLLGDYVYKTSGKNTTEKILIDDIVAKLITSKTYKMAMCKISDISAKAVLEKIIISEEKLIKALENSFDKLRSKSNKSPLDLQLQLQKQGVFC